MGSALPEVDFPSRRKSRKNSRIPARALACSGQEEDTRPYECDGLTAYRRVPMVVALPETEEQVQRVLQTCHALGVPVVPRGAGTGLSGGALPPGDGVLLSLAKFMRMLRIDPVARIARGAARRAQRGDLAKWWRPSACTTRPIRRARSPAPSAATSPRTPAACTA